MTDNYLQGTPEQGKWSLKLGKAAQVGSDGIHPNALGRGLVLSPYMLGAKKKNNEIINKNIKVVRCGISKVKTWFGDKDLFS